MVLLGHACLRVPTSCKDVSNREVDGHLELGPIRVAPRDFLRAGGEEAGRGAGDGCSHPSGYLEAFPPPGKGAGCLPNSTKLLQPCSSHAAAPSSSTSTEACPIATDCSQTLSSRQQAAPEYALFSINAGAFSISSGKERCLQKLLRKEGFLPEESYSHPCG